MDKDLEIFLEDCNNVLSILFALEIVLKLVAFTSSAFWLDASNVADVIIVLISLVGLLGVTDMRVNAFRSFRVMRLFELIDDVPQLDNLEIVVRVVLRTLTHLGIIILLLVLFIFVFATLGMQFFSGHLGGEKTSTRAHYDSFIMAFFTTFQLMTFDSWYKIMFDAMASFGPLAGIYFLVWVVFGRYILLNLLLVLIFKSFATVYKKRLAAAPHGTRYTSNPSARYEETLVTVLNDDNHRFSSKYLGTGLFHKTAEDEIQLAADIAAVRFVYPRNAVSRSIPIAHC
eukprot:SAG11_NODE_541_length_8643_cov_21.904963_3_plen_286_part_00